MCMLHYILIPVILYTYSIVYNLPSLDRNEVSLAIAPPASASSYSYDEPIKVFNSFTASNTVRPVRTYAGPSSKGTTTHYNSVSVSPKSFKCIYKNGKTYSYTGTGDKSGYCQVNYP